jgi:hypothetical protein
MMVLIMQCSPVSFHLFPRRVIFYRLKPKLFYMILKNSFRISKKIFSFKTVNLLIYFKKYLYLQWV